MKFAIAFLLLGICLVPTNANYGQRSPVTRCNKCSDIELFCRQKAFLEDVCFLLKLIAHDLQLSIADLLGSLNCGVHIQYVIYAVQNGNVEQLTLQMRQNRSWILFYKAICRFISELLKEARLDLGYIIASVNHCSGKSLEQAFVPIQDLVNVIHNFGSTSGGKSKPGNNLGGLGNMVGSFTGVANNMLGSLADTAGGLAGAAVDMIGGAANVAGGLTGAAGGMISGASSMLGGLAGAAGVLSGAASDHAGTAGGHAGAAGGMASGFSGAAGSFGVPSSISGGAASGHAGGYRGQGTGTYGSHGSGSSGTAYYSKVISPR